MAPIDDRDEIEKFSDAAAFSAVEGREGKIDAVMWMHAYSFPTCAGDCVEQRVFQFIHTIFIYLQTENLSLEDLEEKGNEAAVFPVSTPMRQLIGFFDEGGEEISKVLPVKLKRGEEGRKGRADYCALNRQRVPLMGKGPVGLQASLRIFSRNFPGGISQMNVAIRSFLVEHRIRAGHGEYR